MSRVSVCLLSNWVACGGQVVNHMFTACCVPAPKLNSVSCMHEGGAAFNSDTCGINSPSDFMVYRQM